jgi:hypothetical protein
MKKHESGSATKDQKNMGANQNTAPDKKAKTTQSTGHSTGAATSNVKSKVGHGMASEGTNVDYKEKR